MLNKEKTNGKFLNKKEAYSGSKCTECFDKIKIELPQNTDPKPIKKSNKKKPENKLPKESINNENAILNGNSCNRYKYCL